jgi:hypothetical protein
VRIVECKAPYRVVPDQPCARFARGRGAPALMGLQVALPGAGLPYQALEVGVSRWRSDYRDTVTGDVLDTLSAAGRDPSLRRLGVPPAQTSVKVKIFSCMKPERPDENESAQIERSMTTGRSTLARR